jgi:hypothetical protein
VKKRRKPSCAHQTVCFTNAKWRKRLGKKPERKLWEIAVLFAIRDSLRSRDIWVVNSRSYQDTKQQLLAVHQAEKILSLPIPLQANEWILKRKQVLENLVKKVVRMMRQCTLPNICIMNEKIHVNRLDLKIPENIDDLTLDIYKRMPQVSITDILREVDQDTGFTDSFTHIYTGSYLFKIQ